MANRDGLLFTAADLRAITGWDVRVIEDYLSVVRMTNAAIPLNPPITPATKTKITYDANGLVIAGTDATAADIVLTPYGVFLGANVQIGMQQLSDAIVAAGIKTLQQAYVDGNTITNTNTDGSVVIDATGVGVTLPPMRIVPKPTFPTTGLLGGAVNLDTDGTMYSYDATRSKWLSVAETAYHFSEGGAADGQYLRVQDISHTLIGYRMPRDGTIEAIKAEGRNLLTKAFDVRINGIDVINFNLVGGLYTSLAENVDFSAGDRLQVFVSNAQGNVRDPLVSLYTKWRK